LRVEVAEVVGLVAAAGEVEVAPAVIELLQDWGCLQVLQLR
jgi:hypothetical protein